MPSLLAAESYSIDTPKVSVKLDQNENHSDLPLALKERVVKKLLEKPWNRYPSAFPDDLHALISKHAGVPAECIITTPGANLLLTIIMNAFIKNLPGKVVIARPSFPLYEDHCRYEGVAFESWNLTADFEYDLNALPKLPNGSFVVFATPNNPTGTVLKKSMFVELLSRHPESFFLADEAYVEFADEDYTDLLAQFPNFMIVRTFSKTWGAAGVRLGYGMGSAELIKHLKKLRLPYLLNTFTLTAAAEILTDAELKNLMKQNVAKIVRERDQIYEDLNTALGKRGIMVRKSQANFLLLKWPSPETCLAAYQKLIASGILVRNVSRSPGLAGCLRITVGNADENLKLVAALKTC